MPHDQVMTVRVGPIMTHVFKNGFKLSSGWGERCKKHWDKKECNKAVPLVQKRRVVQKLYCSIQTVPSVWIKYDLLYL